MTLIFRMDWVVVVMYLATHVWIPDGDLARADPANVALAWGMAAWILAAAVAHGLSRPGHGAPSRRVAAVVGALTVLVWVTAAAAGRWIAFA